VKVTCHRPKRGISSLGQALISFVTASAGMAKSNLARGPLMTATRSGHPMFGRPIGVQIVASFGHDAVVLEIAQRLKNLMPWADRWPALALTV
jgi:Asp-tRNA(Asn)/Glu-tRNA(Gln) amidotransferase A subunit family amidase